MSQPSSFSALQKLDGLGEVPAALDPVGGGDADDDGLVLRESLAHGAEDFEREADAGLERAAVAVGADVGQGRQELVQEVAVRRVDLDQVEARAVGAVRGCDEGGLDAGEAGVVERDGRGPAGQIGEVRGAGRDPGALAFDRAAAFPGRGRAGLAARMGKLDADARSCRRCA